MKPCPACTFHNTDSALQCSVCGAEFTSQSNVVACPACTFENEETASTCIICNAALPGQEEQAQQETWACSVCQQTESELERVVWLACAHRACVDCHVRWIKSQDEMGRDPTCLSCDEERSRRDDPSDTARTLDDNDIRQILGDAAHMARADQLLDKAGYFSCPTPDCGYRVELEEGLTSRRTTCPRCQRVVTVGAAGAAELAAASPRPPAVGASRSGNGTGSADDPHCIERSGSDTDEDETLSQIAERSRKRQRDEEASAEALKHYRVCPGCKQAIEKRPRTCNKFQCRCGTRFCWKCGARADARGNATCKCTDSSHVYWDNERNRTDERPRLQRYG